MSGTPPRLGIASSLLALEGSGAKAISIFYGTGKTVVVRAEFPDGRVVTRWADGLQRALGLLCGATADSETPTIFDAARRASVRLPEGGIGTLVFVAKDGAIATVITREGRHRSIPAVCLKLVEAPIPEPDPEVK